MNFPKGDAKSSDSPRKLDIIAYAAYLKEYLILYQRFLRLLNRLGFDRSISVKA